MNFRRDGLFVLAFAALAAEGACVAATKPAGGETAQEAADRSSLAATVIGQWSETSRLAAKRLIEEYGVPDEVRYGRLVWLGKGAWKRTVVSEIRPPYVEPAELGVVAQTIDFPMGEAQTAAVAAFDPRVSYDAAAQELTSRADREEVNFLRANLAQQVASGRMTPADARAYAANALALEAAGKSAPYMFSLRFAVPR